MATETWPQGQFTESEGIWASAGRTSTERDQPCQLPGNEINQTIRPTKILDYYDGTLVFTAEGDDGQQYVGSIIDTTDGLDRYLVKATTPQRIKDLEMGKVDLRSLMLENPDDDWFLTFDGNAPDQPLELHPQSGSLGATDFLPAKVTSSARIRLLHASSRNSFR